MIHGIRTRDTRTAQIPNLGVVGAPGRLADHHGRPTRGRDTTRPRLTARSQSPLKVQKQRARAQSPYKRPPAEMQSPWKTAAKQLYKEGAASGSSAPPQGVPVGPIPQMNIPVPGQGATPTRAPDVKGKETAANPSPQKVQPQQQQPAEQRSNTASDGPTIADLTAMVQQLCMENKRLGVQLSERKLEVDELRDMLQTIHRGLNAKLKRLYELSGHKDLYEDSS